MLSFTGFALCTCASHLHHAQHPEGVPTTPQLKKTWRTLTTVPGTQVGQGRQLLDGGGGGGCVPGSYRRPSMHSLSVPQRGYRDKGEAAALETGLPPLEWQVPDYPTQAEDDLPSHLFFFSLNCPLCAKWPWDCLLVGAVSYSKVKS